MRRARWKRKSALTRSGAVALRARGAADRCLRRFGPAFGHAILFCDSCDCRPVAGAPTLSERLSHGPATLFAAAGRWLMRVSVWGNATAPTIARAARSEAERAERGTGQMRFCTPAQDAPPPRESTAKCTPHPAAPVDMSPQTRRHHLAPTPVQQLCTHVQSCDQPRSFLLDRARPVFFSGKTNKGSPPRPARWGEEEQGSGHSFRRRRKRSSADFGTTTWGVHLPSYQHGCIHRRGIAIPVPWRGRQSRRFLETASLHPPLAALRRFPPEVFYGPTS